MTELKNCFSDCVRRFRCKTDIEAKEERMTMDENTAVRQRHKTESSGGSVKEKPEQLWRI